jgi:formate/nitrite transporter
VRWVLSFNAPEKLYGIFVESGVVKSKMSAVNLVILGILAGAYIGFAAHLATTVATGETEWFGAKQFLTGAVFSFGLMLVIIPGSELWTGNNLMTFSILEKRIGIRHMFRNWVYVFIANFIGTIILAWIIAWGTGLLDGPVGATALKIAYGKLTVSPEGVGHNTAYFFRAVGCNWLVCLAVVMAAAATDITGKILGIFFPIMAFVASGFEHSIANMYFLSAGIFAKGYSKAVELSGISADKLDLLNWADIWTHNLIAVTLGNFVGGTVFVAMAYWYTNVRKAD